jgi:ureidoacrylate peracid hydrolase
MGNSMPSASGSAARESCRRCHSAVVHPQRLGDLPVAGFGLEIFRERNVRLRCFFDAEALHRPSNRSNGRDTMTRPTYDEEITALLVIDPYNDFISEGGKIWHRIRAVAEANDCVPHMLQVLNAARKAKLRVFYAMHHRYRPGDYETWKYIAPIQKAAWKSKIFEYGTWGGEIRPEFEPKPGEIVATEHWCSSGFANTDLDLQLKKHGIHQLIVIGLIAHTCIEATVRFAAELGYEVTVVKDATADYSDAEMHAALDITIPNYASAIVTTKEAVDSISSL